MRIGVITGSGSYDWPCLEEAVERTVTTDHGAVTVTEGRLGATEIVQVSRHGAAHHRLSSQVDHKANLAALLARAVEAVVSFTVCGSLDPDLRPGSLVVFDDLYFPANRLPDGTLCSWYDMPGVAGRGHWIFDRPFSEPLRRALITAAGQTGVPVATRGVYGHVDGPRFNSRAEVAALASAGVSAVSQTAGPEVVLAGEAELPMALVGFVTDYANGVATEPEPVQALLDRMAESREVFATLAGHVLPAPGSLSGAGFVHRFDG
ncbi:methylthioadenosine phosphorylase [Streptomyces sp. DvalAA-14]|uniref:MTAP family purine nucleoside phosphorylase n=1 Tax=unclassified Streptomyces TaxID=2593676 RepID=UPI00081B06CC|nr:MULTISPECIES: MTAP family purine nucleoside phosphorylase [unclassified Streptomyces]MYS23802.1 phosphorylase [Streptomyces sp. SID4948]SCE38836.1 methylthioadenosine phosphorylase [Streptomyces sp. DvalAA-14]